MLTLIENALVAWTEGARRAGWLVILAILSLTAVAGWYAANHIKVNTDTSSMLDPDLGFQKRAVELREAFPEIKTDILLIVKGETLDEASAFARALAGRLEASPELFESVYAPSADPFFQENGLLYLSEAELSTRMARLSKAAGLIETLVKSPTAGTFLTTLAENDALAEKSDLGEESLRALYEELSLVATATIGNQARPFSWLGALDSAEPPESGYLQFIYATPKLDFSRLQPAKPALGGIRAETDRLAQDFGAGRVETYITGDPALRGDELAAVTRGIGTSFAISFVLVAVLLLSAYRSVYLSVATLASLIITIVLTSAFAAATVGELNLVSVAFTVLLVGLGLDFAIHLLLHVQERRAASQDTKQALNGAVREVGAALTLAAPTTAIGFFAFVPTRFDGIAQLGIIAGAGVIIAFIVAVTFLPAALGVFSTSAAPARSGSVRRGFLALEKLSVPIALAVIALGVAGLFLLPKARFDADPMALRDTNSQSVKGFNLLFADEDTIPYRLTRLVASGDEAIATKDRLRAIDTVRSVRILPDFVPADQDEKLEIIDFAAGSLVFALGADEEPDGSTARQGAEALAARLETGRANDPVATSLAALLRQIAKDEAALARLEKNIFAYWPALIDVLESQLQADYVEIDTLPASLVKRYKSADGVYRVDVLPRDDLRDHAALKTFVRDVEAVYPDIAGGAAQTLKAGEVISGAMLQATSLALAIIAVFLWLLLRKVSDVLLMLFPLLLAAILTTSAGVLLDIPFNYANVIVLPLLLGIGVDSGIHLVLRQRQVDAGDTLYGTSTPRAVLFSALTTVASFGSLIISPHRGTASMGELLSLAILFTLICTLIVLPVALRWRDERTAG